jgi:hypothetical protein
MIVVGIAVEIEIENWGLVVVKNAFLLGFPYLIYQLCLKRPNGSIQIELLVPAFSVKFISPGT